MSEQSLLMNTDKKEFESPVITGEICSEVNNMAASSSYAYVPFFYMAILHFSTFLLIAHHENEKTWKIALTARRI